MKILPLLLALITASLPVILQKTGLSKKYPFQNKMLCAFMYLITGVFSAICIYNVTAFSLLILSALVFGILGDLFLEYKSKKFFALGAGFFAIGHIIYSYTFLFVGSYKASANAQAVIGITLVITAITVFFAKTKLKLHGKKNLLLVYAPVLILAFASSLVSGINAISIGNLSYGLCLISGGILFLSSDIMIGIGKGGIKRPEFLHNAVTYTYFPAQALLALSIYFQ